MPIITITRGSLSATDKLTYQLSKELQCRPISREDIIEHGKKYGIDEFMQAARRIMETKPPHSWDPHAAQIHYYLTMFKASLMDFVSQGNIIYHGLQTHFILMDVPKVFRIKVLAPLEYRVQILTEESNSTPDVARDHILFVDEMRRSWAKFCFGENYDDPTHYDMMLNMSRLNLDAMVHLIASVVQRPEFRVDAGTMKVIRNVHLQSLIGAYLVRSPRTRELKLDYDCNAETGHVKIRRTAPTPAENWQQDVKNALQEIETIKSIEIDEGI